MNSNVPESLVSAEFTPGPSPLIAPGSEAATSPLVQAHQSLPDASARIQPNLGTDVLQPLKTLQHRMLVEGRAVSDLSMVNPDLAPPRLVMDRLLESVTKPNNHRYAVSRGVRRLREAFAEKYRSAFSVNVDPEGEVCVCLGSKDATYHAIRALVREGDRVVVGAPTYPAHASAVALVGAESVAWMPPADPREAALSLGQTLEASRSRLVILNFPNNPSGQMVSAQWWEAVVTAARSHDAFILNDFVYGEMCFSKRPAPSMLAVSGDRRGLLEVYSLSKAYNVPGWRVGALIGDERIVRSVARHKSVADYGLFLPLQFAAASALTATADLVRPTVTAYERRLKVLSHGLKRLGWSINDPVAGASVWARFPSELVQEAYDFSCRSEAAAAASSPGSGGCNSEEAALYQGSQSCSVARFFLEKCGVLAAPGIAFGADFDGFVRFAAVMPEERLRDVVSSLSSR